MRPSQHWRGAFALACQLVVSSRLNDNKHAVATGPQPSDPLNPEGRWEGGKMRSLCTRDICSVSRPSHADLYHNYATYDPIRCYKGLWEELVAVDGDMGAERGCVGLGAVPMHTHRL
jgi:hypothetical protein